MVQEVWVVSSGHQLDYCEYEASPFAVYDASKVTLDELEKKWSGPGRYNTYSRVKECWECDEYVLFDDSDGTCITFTKLKIGDPLNGE